MSNKKNGKIDVIIPAYKAQETILRTVSSIAMQTIVNDVEVTIVNDCCPNGDYSKIVRMYQPYMNIQEIKLDENGGPGVARQKGIDATGNEFFTCMDADDTLASAIALETLKAGMVEPVMLPQGQQVMDGFKCVSSGFMQLGDNLKQMVPHQNDMVWMFGKLYRREFIDKYNIRFNETRANEDTGYNTIVKLLCDNPAEQVRFMPETTYFWHNKTDSITRINDGQYAYDQCFCGWVDNMIYAIGCAKKYRPFSGAVSQQIVGTLINLYFYWIETVARKPVFCDQNWEYIKKFYHAYYQKIEDDISDEVLSQMFSMASMEKNKSGSLIGIIPSIGIREFLDKVKADEYDENHIYEVWERMREDPDTLKLIENNEKCGVCAEGYTNRPFTAV